MCLFEEIIPLRITILFYEKIRPRLHIQYNVLALFKLLIS